MVLLCQASAAVSYDSLLEQVKKKNDESKKKYDDARRIQLSKECVSCDVYLTDFEPKQEDVSLGDVMKNPPLGTPTDADVVEEANIILDVDYKGFNSDE